MTNDQQKRQELLEKTGMMTVPVTTDGKSYVVGPNFGKLAELIQNLAPQAV